MGYQLGTNNNKENIVQNDKKKRNDYRVSPERFVVAWQASKSVAEVAEKLSIPEDRVLSRASSYRKKGVLLKKFVPKSLALDVDKLNGILKRNRTGKRRGA